LLCGSDSPVAGGACAPAISTPDTLPARVRKLQSVDGFAAYLRLVGGERSGDNATSEPSTIEGAEGKQPESRDNHLDVNSTTTTSTSSATDACQADHSAGAAVPAEAADTRPTWPDEPELLQLGRQMLTGGSGTPAAPGRTFELAKADHELLVCV
jgi:predicted secreted protein